MGDIDLANDGLLVDVEEIAMSHSAPRETLIPGRLESARRSAGK